MLVLVDVASNLILDWELAPSVNAASTVRLINRVCNKYGIFDELYTDNGAAFAGHLVAGSNPHRFRNGKPKEGTKPVGICSLLDIKLRFALPENGQAKIAERIFATVSRVVDDRPEFAGAHAEHKPGASPSAKVKPVAVETAPAVLRREIDRHNREGGRRGQGARGRSYLDVFQAGLAQRTVRRLTARQRYLASLIWKPVSVDRNGQVKANGWIYGGPSTM